MTLVFLILSILFVAVKQWNKEVFLRCSIVCDLAGGMGSVQSYSTYGAPLASSQPTGSADFSQSGTATGADLLSKAFTGIQQFAGSVFTLLFYSGFVI